ncbi:MAG: preprotein translocase subunit SecG [Alphaproteobacteria bacterium]|nr:preprotein translocase subunit SecG [Alphaproteobacteria bacterium]MBV8549496.1 preprotein translocase subunit SecG [Alphaproteobacteria bacterium]
MSNVLLILQLLIAVALIVVILLQKSAQDGGGLMGGGATMGGLFTARGSANILTRITAILATVFILNSLVLGYIASAQHKQKSILDQVAPVTNTSTTNEPAKTDAPPAAPTVPMAK